MEVKIIQIWICENDYRYQGALLGLGSDGVVYKASGSMEWEVYFPLRFKAEQES